MPCELFYDGEKAVGFICSKGRSTPQPCYKCGRPSTRLCDHREMELHYERDKHGNVVRKVWVPSTHTCDRPMCDACANRVGPDTDFCDEHNTEIARARSAKAEQLYRAQLRRER